MPTHLGFFSNILGKNHHIHQLNRLLGIKLFEFRLGKGRDRSNAKNDAQGNNEEIQGNNNHSTKGSKKDQQFH